VGCWLCILRGATPFKLSGPKETSANFQQLRVTRDHGAEPNITLSGPVRLLPGRTVPNTRYRILRWLGEGGMGVVYKAEHVDLGRTVALKLLRNPEQLDPKAAQNFRDEARAASSIGSKNIVDVFDFGELPDGRLLYAMELVDGTSLADDLLQQGPFSAQRLIPVLRQICKGLAAAHSAGVVHCDIKPENILLTRAMARYDHVKIVDFGISKIQGSGGDKLFSGTGTPPYMAPEQCLGLAYDGRLDMYALGCTAYEMVVGQPPFVANALDEVLRSQVEETPAPLAEAMMTAGHQDRPPIPPALEAVIMRCLRKRPEERFSDMADLEAAICEAQIEAKIETDWDSLPLPDVEPERRARLVEGMPSADEFAAGPKWRALPLALATLTLLASLAFFFTQPNVVDEADLALIDTATHKARAAAARAYYVYPPAENPHGDTAYKVMLALQTLDNVDEDLRDTRSLELRREFAETLERLGDRYWDHKSGRRFASDYYAQAQIFDPTNQRVKERAALLSGEVSALRRAAATGNFSAQVLKNAETLVILAEDDLSERNRKLAAQLQANGASLNATTQAQLYDLAGIEAPSLREEIAAEYRRNEQAADKERNKDDDETLDPVPFDVPAPHGRPEAGEHLRERDRAMGKKLATKGTSALAHGRVSFAERLFQKAISADSRNAAALMGLSDIFFDRGQYKRAGRFGERAVSSAPRNGAYRIRLGDAYFKLFRYPLAKKHYQKAKVLGHKHAKTRLLKVNAKLDG